MTATCPPASSRPETRRPACGWRVGLALGFLGFLLDPVWAQTLLLTLGDVRGPGFAARGLVAAVRLQGSQPLTLDVAELRVGERVWQGLRLVCGASHIGTDRIECAEGRLASEPTLRLHFVHDLRSRALSIAALGPGGERWRLWRGPGAAGVPVEIEVSEGALTRLTPHLPTAWPLPSAGRLNGRALMRRDAAGRLVWDAEGRIKELAFSDPAGLRAGEAIGARFRVHARHAGEWEGRLELDWDQGEVFWSPLFLPAAVRHLTARGRFAGGSLILEDARLSWEGVGSVTLAGRWRPGQGLEELKLGTDGLDLGPLWQASLRPVFAGRAAGELSLSGRLRGHAELSGGRLVRAEAELEDGRVGHVRGLFALEGLRLSLPWRSTGQGRGWIAATGGHLRGVGIGPFSGEIRAEAGGLQVDRFTVPLLDGGLELSNLRLLPDTPASPWRAEGEAVLRPVSMERLSLALGWPRMHGTVSAVVPRVEWRGGVLGVGGAILFRVFDGTVVVKNLRVEGLAGPASRAEADVDMRNLDLGLLTRTFSFGRIEGRLDVAVADLVLSRWKPVRFSASVASSPGDYPRRISQRAVDNIAALGGGSAAAALQKSFLRFFEDFRYRRIGLSGHLQRGVLTLSGLRSQGDGFVIVEGGGIPALTVIGYNREVGWNELLERLSRIRQGAAPVIR